MELNYDNVVLKMLEAFPDITTLYNEEVDWYDGGPPGPHVIFGDIFNPYVIDLLEAESQVPLLQRVFAFLEEMAASEDIRVQEVLACTILERLGDDPIILKRGRRYMGSKTLRISDEVERGWGRKRRNEEDMQQR